MRVLLLIAKSEWQYWIRSQVVIGGTLLFVALLVTTSVLTGLRIDAETHARSHQQSEAEETFLAQPDRHPHRMVHYGHYLFRAPAPLAIFDPGLDAVTGHSIFLEGHRQNSATFAASDASADLGGLSWLSPALIYQLFAPLLIILLGHASIVREREASTLIPLLAQGLAGHTLMFGKALAIFSFIILLLVPLIISGVAAISFGESPVTVMFLAGAYLSYLTIWGMLTLCLSALLRKRSEALALLAAVWLGITLVMPSLAVNVAERRVPLAGKIETDLTMLSDLRKLGDGHNAKDPAFAKLRENLLKQYGVERVEDLPVNFRGLVAVEAEQKLTKVLNDYAEARMEGESRQATLLAKHGWFTPALAIAFASRTLSGTDLEHYHRFLREAEALRFDFVQGLNRAHVDKLSYGDDINRNKDEASWRRARVNASTWEVLDRFNFEPDKPLSRLENTLQSVAILLVWLILLLLLMVWAGRRLQP